ncbi:MAG: SGNH/GDSL hydrolase family protein [Flavitalea sp.]
MRKKMINKAKVFRIAAYSLYLLVFVVFCLEIFLRIYNPFDFRQKGNSIILPRNRKMIFSNRNIPVLEQTIIHTKNSLGFRGPEMPPSFEKYTSIVAVGGSATECFFLSDSNCWSNQLEKKLKLTNKNTWVNNAGFQGHSTYGHFILINEYVKYLHPKFILLMAGFNEIDREDIREDESVARISNKNTAWGWMKRNSEIVNVTLNIERHIMADRLSVTDGYVDLQKGNNQSLELNNSEIDSALKIQKPLIEAFRKRLNKILDTCLSNGIHPILVTQPILFGRGADNITGANLETYKIRNGYNGLMMWKILEEYNNVSRQMAVSKNVFLIDLATEMPKSSLFFYDICHFSNQGALKVSEILERHLMQYFLKEKASNN